MFWADNSTNSSLLELPSGSSPIQSSDIFKDSAVRSITFVDAHVADFATVMANTKSDITVLLDPTQDGVAQITNVLSHYQNLTAVEIVSHGNTGAVQLGKSSLNANSLSQHVTELQKWNNSLAAGADILLYGCYVATGEAGQTFIQDFSSLTGADVAASSNLTGNAAQGGDWQLEYATGKIETATSFNNTFTSTYQGSLQSIFTTQTPDNPNQSDGVGAAGDYELGTEFVSTKAGKIEAIRYYKAPGETGSHTGKIWSSTGTLLGSIAFSNETASGWQQQALTTPLNIAANTTYVVSVNANSHFAVSGNAIATTITNGDLSAVADGSNGVYNSSPAAFPTASNNSNYFRDIVFTPVTNVNNVGKVILKGSATVGRTLTETILDADGLNGGTINYRWQQSTNGTSWSNITGATAKSLALTNGLLGKQVRVRTTYTDAFGTRENIVSAGTTITAQNAIVLENQKAGTTDWQVGSNFATNNEIAGYGDASSINKGQAINLKVSLAQAGKYNLDVYRLGYYGGAGGRLISSVTGLNGVTQAAPTIDPTTRLVESKWNTSYTLQTTPNWTTGLYLAKLTDSNTGKQSYVEFVVRDDNRPAEIGFQEANNTVAAYNNYGGYSSYAFNSINNQPAYKVSFDRPLSPTTQGFLAWEYQTASWAEAQGYDISYYANTDVQTNPFQLYSQNAFLSVGHDEYWSLDMRNNIEKARDNGTNLAFFSANSAYWRVRYEPSTTGQANRVLAIYKDDWNLDPIAQLDNSQATTRFRSAQVNRPENALLGVMYTGQTSDVTGGFDFVVSNAADPYYAGTGLKNGDKIPGLVGYEWDGVVNNGLTPAGLVVLSSSPANPDAGVGPGLPSGTPANISNAVRYTTASGAKVFSSGSIQWVWGLNGSLTPNPRPSPLAQKIATNVFADLGAKARTLTTL